MAGDDYRSAEHVSRKDALMNSRITTLIKLKIKTSTGITGLPRMRPPSLQDKRWMLEGALWEKSMAAVACRHPSAYYQLFSNA
jgi:hypothetical protein